MKLFPKRNKNLLPLLAVTVLVLSLALVNYSEFLSSTVENTQSVLSKSDENEDENDNDDESATSLKTDEPKPVNSPESKDDRKEEKIKKEEARKQELRKQEAKKLEARKETEKPKSSGIVRIEAEVENEEDENEVENESESRLEIENEFEQESETASDDGTINKFKLKIKTRTVAGKTIIETASGEMEVENSPTDAVNSLVDNDILDTPTSFEAKTNDDNKVEFEVQGLEVKKLLGLFSVNLPKSVTLDADTGEVIASKQGVWTRFLSLLSI